MLHSLFSFPPPPFFNTLNAPTFFIYLANFIENGKKVSYLLNSLVTHSPSASTVCVCVRIAIHSHLRNV